MTGAPLGQRPTNSDANVSAGIPSVEAVAMANLQNAGTSWRRRRHTK
jgi:hypothetical protein